MTRPLNEIIDAIGKACGVNGEIPRVPPITAQVRKLGKPLNAVEIIDERAELDAADPDADYPMYWLEFGDPYPVETDTPYGIKHEGYTADLQEAWRDGLPVSESRVPDHVLKSALEKWVL